MLIDKYINEGRPRLLLFFNGWSASPALFHDLEPESDQDVWIVYDYRDLNFNEDLSIYHSITLMAWSLGVWVAEQIFAERKGVNFEQKIAIAGTGRPADDLEGIPVSVFQGTVDHLNLNGVCRFNRRMCGAKPVLEKWNSVTPRPFDEISEELHFLYSAICQKENAVFEWTKAIVTMQDRIFPAVAQMTHWKRRGVSMVEYETSHYLFYLWKQWKIL